MVLELKLRKVGNSVGVVLPTEALARLNAGNGDAIYLTDTTDGGFRVTAANPEFARKLKGGGAFKPPLSPCVKGIGEMKEPVWLESCRMFGDS